MGLLFYARNNNFTYFPYFLSMNIKNYSKLLFKQNELLSYTKNSKQANSSHVERKKLSMFITEIFIPVGIKL